MSGNKVAAASNAKEDREVTNGEWESGRTAGDAFASAENCASTCE